MYFTTRVLFLNILNKPLIIIIIIIIIINTRLVDFVNLGVLFLSMWINSC